ncbi:MAG: flippase [Chitinophagaceae bacterium]
MAFVAVVQIGNYVLPLAVTPYLTRVLGPEKFGLISFAQTFIGYFSVFINYGFDLTATREISINRDNPGALSRTFSHLIVVKILLFLISTCLLFVSFAFSKFSSDASLYLVTHLLNIGMVLFPMWFFQGLEKVKLLSILNFCIKLLFTIGIFVMIRHRSDYLYVNLLLSVSQIVIGVTAFSIAIRRFGVKFTGINMQYAWKLIREGFWVFFSTAVVLAYTTTNIFLLGISAGNVEVGYFTVVYKIIMAVHAMVVLPINIAFFPFISRQFHEDPKKAVALFKKASIVLLLVTSVIAAGLFVLAKPIVLFFGAEYAAAIPIMRIMSILPVLLGLVNIWGFNGLVAIKQDKFFSAITATGATLSIGLNLLLIPRYGIHAAAQVWIMTEFIIFVSCFLVYRLKTKHISKLI